MPKEFGITGKKKMSQIDLIPEINENGTLNFLINGSLNKHPFSGGSGERTGNRTIKNPL